MFGNIIDKVTMIKLSSTKNIIRKFTNKEVVKTLAAVHTHTHTHYIVF